MRRFLSLLMVVLLALRGLAGDAMAMDNPAGHASMAGTMVMPVGSHVMDMDDHAHHAGHSDAHASHADAISLCSSNSSHSSASSDGCDSHDGHCTTCGLCHTALGQPQWALFDAPAPATIQPAHGADRFASIAPMALIKPPIFAV